MNARDRALLAAMNDENTRTPEDRARAIRIRAREAQQAARERQARGESRATRTPGDRNRNANSQPGRPWKTSNSRIQGLQQQREQRQGRSR